MSEKPPERIETESYIIKKYATHNGSKLFSLMLKDDRGKEYELKTLSNGFLEGALSFWNFDPKHAATFAKFFEFIAEHTSKDL